MCLRDPLSLKAGLRYSYLQELSWILGQWGLSSHSNVQSGPLLCGGRLLESLALERLVQLLWADRRSIAEGAARILARSCASAEQVSARWSGIDVGPVATDG